MMWVEHEQHTDGDLTLLVKARWQRQWDTPTRYLVEVFEAGRLIYSEYVEPAIWIGNYNGQRLIPIIAKSARASRDTAKGDVA